MTTGEWLAPYSDTVVVDPGKLDVDHMVPLGNAHDSGAWNWSANRREQYANYLDVTVQTWWVELAEGGLPNAGTGGGGYVIYRAWILKLTSPPSTAMC